MALVKIDGMSRSIADFFIILFIYTVNGTPLGDKPESREIKYGYLTYYKSDSLGKDAAATFHWPRGVVQYLFDNSSYDVMLKDKLRLSMKSLEKESCVRFKELTKKPASNTSSWLHFTNRNKERECFHSPVPQENGEIQVILGYDCLKQSEITHALMHGIGFRDEITHPNRDLYVKILWNNIQPAHWKLFGRYVTDDPGQLSEYDPRSIMHFHDHAFSVNGQATINGLIPGLKIAPSENLSHLDKMKLGLKFGHECNKRKVGELLETCQDIFTKNKNVSSNEADDPKPMSQNGTVSTDKMNSDEHNVIILGRDIKGKSDNKNPSNSFNVDSSKPGNNDDQSEESEIPQEPRMDFDYENGQNAEPQMDYEYHGNETDRNDTNSNNLDEDNEDGNADDPKPMSQNGTVSTDKMNSDEHNVIILGRDKKGKSDNKNPSNSFNVDSSKPGNNDDQSEESEIPQEPRMDFDYENGQNAEPQMDYEYHGNETDRNDKNSNNLDEDNEDGNADDPKPMSQNGTVSTDKMNSDEHNVIILGRDKKGKSDNKNPSNSLNVDSSEPGKNQSEESEIPQEPRMDFDYENGQDEKPQMNYEYHDNETDQNDKNSKDHSISSSGSNSSSVKYNQYNHFNEKNSKTLDKDNEDGNHKVFDGNLGSDNNKYDKENEEELGNDDSENVSPPKLNFDSDSGDIESENTNKGNGNIAIFNNNKKVPPNSKNIAAQNDTKLSNKKNVKHVNTTNKDDVNIVVVGYHDKLRPNSKNIAVQNNTNTLSVKYNQYHNFYEDDSKTLDTDNEDGNHKVSDGNLGSDKNKYDKENEEELSDESENVSPPKLNFDSDSGGIESENTNKGNGNIAIFNNNNKLPPNSKHIAAQNDTKLSNKNNVKHVNITNKDDVNIFVIGHHNKLRPNSKNIGAQNNTNTLSIKYNQYNHLNEDDSKTLNTDNEDGNHKASDGNLGSDNNKYDKENEEELSNDDTENVSPPKLNFDSDGDIESENTNKGNGNIAIFNNNKKLPPISKNIAVQNDTKLSNKKNVKHVNISGDLANGHTGTNNVHRDKIKLAYADITDTSDPEDDKKASDTNDNNDNDENDANNTDDNKGDGNTVVFNNNKQLHSNSKNISAQNNTKISHVKSAKHVNIPNKDHVNIVVVGHHNKVRPHSQNITAQNDTKLSNKKNVKHVNITKALANGDTGTNNVHRDKIKLAYADMTDKSDSEDDKNVSETNDNNDNDENDANNTDDNKGNGNIATFNYNKKLRSNSKNIAAQNNTKISHVKSAKHVNIPNEDHVNIEDDKNISYTNDNNDNDENDANNTDDNKVI